MSAEETFYKWTDPNSVEHIVKILPRDDPESSTRFEFFVRVADVEEITTGKRFIAVPLSSLIPLQRNAKN